MGIVQKVFSAHFSQSCSGYWFPVVFLHWDWGGGRGCSPQSCWLHQALGFISVPGLLCRQDCVDEGESLAQFTLGAVFALSWGTKATLSILLYLLPPSESKHVV